MLPNGRGSERAIPGSPDPCGLIRLTILDGSGYGRLLVGAGSRGAELVTFDGHGGAALIAAHRAAINHELDRAGIVEQYGPTHGQSHRHPAGELVFRTEPNARAGEIQRLAGACLGNTLAVEHLVFHFQLDREAAFAPPLQFSSKIAVVRILHARPPPSIPSAK